MITKEHVAALRELFFYQSDHHAEMWKSKSDRIGYSPACKNKFSDGCKQRRLQCDDCDIKAPQPLTDDRLLAHLGGKITLGAYQLKNDKVKWLCFDFDVEEGVDPLRAFPLAVVYWQTLDHLGVASYLETSGGKGIHLWVFFKAAVTASLAREFGLRLGQKIQSDEGDHAGVSVEIFPKQDKTGEYGNLVKVPLSKHKRTGAWCHFINPDGSHIADQLGYLLSIQTVSGFVIEQAMSELPEFRNERQQGPAPQVDDIIPSGQRNERLTSLAGSMRRRGMNADEILVALEVVNDRRCRPPLPHDELEQIAGSVGRYPAAIPPAKSGRIVGPHYELSESGIWYVIPKTINSGGELVTVENRLQVTNFSMGITSELIAQDEDQTETRFTLAGFAGKPFAFDIAASDLADDRKLRANVLNRAGGKAIIMAGQTRHVLPAVQSLSNGYQREVRYVSTGWQKVGDEWIFVAPGGSIGIDMARCDLPTELRNYRVSCLPTLPAESMEAIGCLLDAFDYHVSYPAVAHAFLAPLLRFLPTVKRYALHLTGETGSLKTTYATLLLCLFGDFGNEEPTEKWGSTWKKIEKTGHYAKDVLYVVDDYKPRYVSIKDVTQLIQNYSDGRGRGRLRADTSLQESCWIRGALLMTGEDMPHDEASVMSRLLVVNMRRQDGKNLKLARASELAKYLPMAMGAFIEYVRERNDEWTDENEITKKRDWYLTSLSGQNVTNAGRVATNIAQNWYAWQKFAEWMRYCGAWSEAEYKRRSDEYDTAAWDLLIEMSDRISEEKVSNVFLESIRGLLAGSEAVLIDKESAETPPSGKLMLGWRDSNGIYMQPSVAFHAVEKWLGQIGRSLGFSEGPLWDQLESDGLLIHRRKQIRAANMKSPVHVHQFSLGILSEVNE